jgi:hypothetical protein
MCRPSTSRLFFWHKSHDPEPPNSLIPILHSKNKYVVLVLLVLLVLLLLVGAQQSGFSCCVALYLVARRERCCNGSVSWSLACYSCSTSASICATAQGLSLAIQLAFGCIRLHSVAFGCIADDSDRIWSSTHPKIMYIINNSYTCNNKSKRLPKKSTTTKAWSRTGPASRPFTAASPTTKSNLYN